MLLLYIWFARIRTGSLHDFFCLLFLFSYIPFSFRSAVVFFFVFFLHWLSKTRRKQSVNPIHELRNTCDRLTIYFSHCVLLTCSYFSFWFSEITSRLLFKYLLLDGDLDFTFDQIIWKKKKEATEEEVKNGWEEYNNYFKVFQLVRFPGWMNLSQIF